MDRALIDGFVRKGFVRIDDAFPRPVAAECRSLLWQETGCDEADPTTWTRPVIRLADRFDPPFRAAANTPQLWAAFDALVGAGRWVPRGSVGTFPIRFPSPIVPDDCGWHIDVSLGWENEPDFLAWRANVTSEGRALLMLFLFSDVGEADAPTRLRAGSHLDVARRLAPHGAAGLSLRELASTDFSESSDRPEVLATGPAGTVYLCHPFLVHCAQPHRGRVPKFMAQPALLPRVPLDPFRTDGLESPVERAIRVALE